MPNLPRSRILAQLVVGAALVPWMARAQALPKIRVAGAMTDDMTPICYAVQNGFYRRAGLDVEIVATTSGSVATQAVIAGTYEIGKSSLIASLIAHIRGLPLVIVGNQVVVDNKNPYTLALVAADSTIKTAADLNGKICASAALNDLNQLALQAWIDKNGGDLSSIKWVEVPGSAAGAAIEEHRIDACCMQEPQLSASLKTGKTRVFASVYEAIAPRFVSSVFIAQPDWASKNAGLLARWLRSTYDAAAYTNGHHAETAAMMAEYTKVPLGVIQSMRRPAEATQTDPSMIQPVIEIAAKYKSIPYAFAAKDAYFHS
jgi:NitT/TauT family transport system substrate-binding protein